MKSKLFATILAIALATGIKAGPTIPVSGHVINADDPGIQYVGRVDFTNPQRPAFNFPGTEIRANFEGTSLKMIARPMSGYFMVSIDSCEAFKVSLNCPADSVVTLATALRDGRHSVRIAYAMEGLDTHPELWGFVLDNECDILRPTALPDRRIEFIGNSITCAYGVESTEKTAPFEYATENHFYSYASRVSDALGAIYRAVASASIAITAMRARAAATACRRSSATRSSPTAPATGTTAAGSPTWCASTSAPTTSRPTTTTLPSTSRPTASFLPRCVASTPRRRSFSSPVRCSVRRRTASRRPSSTSYRRKVASTATRMSIASTSHPRPATSAMAQATTPATASNRRWPTS